MPYKHDVAADSCARRGFESPVLYQIQGETMSATPEVLPIPFEDGQEGLAKPPRKKVFLTWIQDRSGSMTPVWDETLTGFEVFLRELEQKNVEDIDYRVSLTVFDATVNTPVIAEPIATVNKDHMASFKPRGYTALYDAVGKSIKVIEATAPKDAEILVIIATDGKENASTEYKPADIRKLVNDKTEAGWIFTYMGANKDAWDEATDLGVSAGNTMSYTAGKSTGRNQIFAASVTRSFSHAEASNLNANRRSYTAYMDADAVGAAGVELDPDTKDKK